MSSFKTCGRGCAPSWDVRCCCEINCPSKNSDIMFSRCPMRVSTFFFTLRNDYDMNNRATKFGGIQEMCLEAGLTEDDAAEVIVLWKEDHEVECEEIAETVEEVAKFKHSPEYIQFYKSLSPEVCNALEYVIDYSYQNESDYFMESLNDDDDKLDHEAFVERLKEGILYHLIVLSAGGSSCEINREVEELWKDYQSQLGDDEEEADEEEADEVVVEK